MHQPEDKRYEPEFLFQKQRLRLVHNAAVQALVVLKQ